MKVESFLLLVFLLEFLHAHYAEISNRAFQFFLWNFQPREVLANPNPRTTQAQLGNEQRKVSRFIALEEDFFSFFRKIVVIFFPPNIFSLVVCSSLNLIPSDDQQSCSLCVFTSFTICYIDRRESW